MKTFEVKKGFVAENFIDYHESDILPLDENCAFGKGYSFLLETYDCLFVNIGLFNYIQDFLNDLDEHAYDGGWDVELIVADNGKFFLEFTQPYDYDGDVKAEVFELVGDLDELKSWVKDGLGYVKSNE